MHRTLIAAGALIVCLAASSTPIMAAKPTVQLPPSVLKVHIRGFKFNPTPMKIHSGDRVTFVNDDEEAHTVTSDDKSFDSEGLDGGKTWQHVFTKPGTYNYFCELHPYMKATIIVLPAASGSKHKRAHHETQ
jgi:plastocyanin